ncbi:MAG TPA: condensation domain-containing protein, partial [Thermoanaerobaculia bacterium]|nr:condensation domain-containing protein [Thermoanaerobaculia bacterium]
MTGRMARPAGDPAARASSGPPPLVAAARDRPLPLSWSQQHRWWQWRCGREEAVAAAYELAGPLRPAALAASLAAVARRHEVLRTRFVEVAGETRQEVQAAGPVTLPLVDLSALAAAAAELARLAGEEAPPPGDPASAPPWRALLVRLGGERHVLLLAAHPLIADARSLDLLLGEAAAHYAAALAGDGSPRPGLPELPIQYGDFAAWQAAWPPQMLAGQLAYWCRELAALPPPLVLPGDRRRPAGRRRRGARRELPLPPVVVAELRRAARREGVTLHTLLLAAWAALLARYTGRRDLLIGMPVDNRVLPLTGRSIGPFANILALRVRPDLAADFRRLLGAVREAVLAASAHRDLPCETAIDGPAGGDDGRPIEVTLAWH